MKLPLAPVLAILVGCSGAAPAGLFDPGEGAAASTGASEAGTAPTREAGAYEGGGPAVLPEAGPGGGGGDAGPDAAPACPSTVYDLDAGSVVCGPAPDFGGCPACLPWAWDCGDGPRYPRGVEGAARVDATHWCAPAPDCVRVTTSGGACSGVGDEVARVCSVLPGGGRYHPDPGCGESPRDAAYTCCP